MIVGQRDLDNGEVTLRDMASGDEEQIPVESVVDELA
nr:His/Gly/Thr/Pro-type tRNA ligase C-terminal domain-containing protein [Halapricum sp. CBA1109]